jgi:hypothetical protein
LQFYATLILNPFARIVKAEIIARAARALPQIK